MPTSDPDLIQPDSVRARVLRCFHQRPVRDLDEIVVETRQPRAVVERALTDLRHRGLIAQGQPKPDALDFTLTDAGKGALVALRVLT